MSMSMDQALRFSYTPKDDELIACLLRPMATGEPLPFDATFIHHADVYAASPDDLVAGRCAAPGTDRSGGVWYFACTARFKSKKRACGRRQRAVSAGGAGEGTWHSEGGVKTVHGAGGRYQKFSYGAKISGVFKRDGWCMTEYQLDDDDGRDEDSVDRLVLCKVYPSPRHAPRAAATTAISVSGKKRKLPPADVDDHKEASPSVRRPRLDQPPPQQQQQGLQSFAFDARALAYCEQAYVPRKKDQATITPSLFGDDQRAPAAMAEQDPMLREMSSFLLDEQRPTTTVAEEDIDESQIEAMKSYLLSDSENYPSTSTEPQQLPEPEEEFVQTVHGPCPDDELIARLAAGQTIDDLFGPASPPPACTWEPAYFSSLLACS